MSRLGLLVDVVIGVPAAEEAVGYGDANEEEVEELPAPGDDGFVCQLRGLGCEDGEDGNEDADEDGFVDEVGKGCHWVLLGFLRLGFGGVGA